MRRCVTPGGTAECRRYRMRMSGARAPVPLHVDAVHVQFTRGTSTKGVRALSECSARSTATWPLFNNEDDSILGVVQPWLIATLRPGLRQGQSVSHVIRGTAFSSNRKQQ